MDNGIQKYHNSSVLRSDRTYEIEIDDSDEEERHARGTLPTEAEEFASLDESFSTTTSTGFYAYKRRHAYGFDEESKEYVNDSVVVCRVNTTGNCKRVAGFFTESNTPVLLLLRPLRR